MQYPIKEIPSLGIVSYTQRKNAPYNLFTEDNLYFMNVEQQVNTINNIVNGGDYIIFDTETNGLNGLGESLPFQVAAIKYRNGQIVDRLNIFINIGIIDDFILQLTGLSQSDVDNGYHPIEALDIILEFIDNENYILAHNAGFDIAIINNLIVSQGYELNRKIKVYDSMAMYYVFYKHILLNEITGSSLDYLATVLFHIDKNNEKRHQADYDCELVDMLLKNIKKDFLENQEQLEQAIIEDQKIRNFIDLLLSNPRSEQNMEYVRRYAQEINDMYNEYYEELMRDNIELQNAISNYLIKLNGEDFSELILGDIFIKKNKKFKTVKNKYLSNWDKIETSFYTDKGYKVMFFFEHNIFDTNIIINNDEELIEAVNKNILIRQKMAEYQSNIKLRLKILREHQKATNYTNYGSLVVKKEQVIAYNERVPYIYAIEKDIKDGIITSFEDLIEERNYNTNLTTAYIRK